MKNQLLKIKLSLIINLFVVALLISGCSIADNAIEDVFEETQEDLEEENNEVIGSLTAKINGNEFTASRLIIGPTLAGNVTITDNGYFLNIVGIDPQISLNKQRGIGLHISGFNFDEIVAGATFNTPNIYSIAGLEPGAFAIYIEDDNTEDDNDGIVTEEIREISIEITSIDREKQLISGRFSFDAKKEEENFIYKVTEGIFTNITYDIN